MSEESLRLPVSSGADLLELIPSLLGFRPEAGDLALIVMTGDAEGQISRVRLVDPPEPDVVHSVVRTGLARYMLLAPARIMGVGYGSAELVTPYLDKLAELCEERDVVLLDALRAEGGRYWSEVYPFPAEGLPYDDVGGAKALELMFAGTAPVVTLEERRRLEMPTAEQAGNDALIEDAAQELFDLVEGEENAYGRLVHAGRRLVNLLVCQCAEGRETDAKDLAMMGQLLPAMPVRDHAWALMSLDAGERHAAMWRAVVARTPRHGCAPAAALLAFTSWQAGDLSSAQMACDLAADVHAGYTLAGVVSAALAAHLDPTEPPMSTETVAETYGIPLEDE